MDVSFVTLRDGRLVAYRELGCTRGTAKRSLLVLHGLGSSRLAAMPGVDEELLREYGVRLTAIDRPGYGKSDPDPNQTLRSSAEDIEEVIDKLRLGDKVWLLGYSCGGGYAWAVARYIPHRIHDIALWAPVGSYWWKGITDEQRDEMLSHLTPNSRALFPYMRYLPKPFVRFYGRFVLARLAGQKWINHCKRTFSQADQKYIVKHEPLGHLLKDNLESVTSNKGFGLAKDLELLITSDWGFEPDEVASVFKGKIHIWQGTEDTLVPVALQRWIKAEIPQTVELYELPGEGHLSWFCHNDEAHRQVFETIFADK